MWCHGTRCAADTLYALPLLCTLHSSMTVHLCCQSAHLLQKGDCLLWAADVLRHCDRHLGQAELVQTVRKA